MTTRSELARLGVVAALRLRQKYRRSLGAGLNPYDLAEGMGLTVRFEALSSLEGVYCSSVPPTIILSSLRPIGRRAFTCAHEIGHHLFRHGTKVDEVAADEACRKKFKPEEYLADRFAAELLMPKLAVQSAFAERHLNVHACTPESIYIIAGVLGVGFGTLIDHMQFTLGLLSLAEAAPLRRAAPKAVKEQLAGCKVPFELLVLDEHWRRPADIEVADIVRIPSEFALTGEALKICHKDGPIVLAQGACPGESTVISNKQAWTGVVRVARRGYQGLSKYRYLEDPEYAV